YKAIYHTLYGGDRALTLRRGFWGLALGTIGTLAFYGMYLWIALAAIDGEMTIGAMTMYVVVFKQGQSALSNALSDIGGMYEDNLYLSNLYEFLDTPVPPARGDSSDGPLPDDGVRFDHVTFTYPGSDKPALSDVT